MWKGRREFEEEEVKKIEEIGIILVRKKIEKYWGIVKGEKLNVEEIDRIIEGL